MHIDISQEIESYHSLFEKCIPRQVWHAEVVCRIETIVLHRGIAEGLKDGNWELHICMQVQALVVPKCFTAKFFPSPLCELIIFVTDVLSRDIVVEPLLWW